MTPFRGLFTYIMPMYDTTKKNARYIFCCIMYNTPWERFKKHVYKQHRPVCRHIHLTGTHPFSGVNGVLHVYDTRPRSIVATHVRYCCSILYRLVMESIYYEKYTFPGILRKLTYRIKTKNQHNKMESYLLPTRGYVLWNIDGYAPYQHVLIRYTFPVGSF